MRELRQLGQAAAAADDAALARLVAMLDGLPERGRWTACSTRCGRGCGRSACPGRSACRGCSSCRSTAPS
ncbi:hypothetical protein [Dankookia sp. P2]|uniref:hypothetical protein n=1 Tax=Dankookia sp. P2 TaxID=3423955 RepID=UPI003D66681C